MSEERNVDVCALSATGMPASADTQTLDAPPKFTRPPLDRLFTGALLSLTLLYGFFLVAVELTPRTTEDERQGHMGVVEAQPDVSGARGIEGDPATGVAEVGGSARAAYYYGGGTPRPIEAVVGGDGERSPEAAKTSPAPARRSPATARAQAVQPGSEPEPKPKVGTLGLDRWVRAGVLRGFEATQMSTDLGQLDGDVTSPVGWSRPSGRGSGSACDP